MTLFKFCLNCCLILPERSKREKCTMAGLRLKRESREKQYIPGCPLFFWGGGGIVRQTSVQDSYQTLWLEENVRYQICTLLCIFHRKQNLMPHNLRHASPVQIGKYSILISTTYISNNRKEKREIDKELTRKNTNQSNLLVREKMADLKQQKVSHDCLRLSSNLAGLLVVSLGPL